MGLVDFIQNRYSSAFIEFKEKHLDLVKLKEKVSDCASKALASIASMASDAGAIALATFVIGVVVTETLTEKLITAVGASGKQIAATGAFIATVGAGAMLLGGGLGVVVAGTAIAGAGAAVAIAEAVSQKQSFC